MEVHKCYMVFRDGKHGKKPKYKHADIAKAFEEAERLTRETGDKFIIVEVIGAVMFTESKGLQIVEATNS